MVVGWPSALNPRSQLDGGDRKKVKSSALRAPRADRKALLSDASTARGHKTDTSETTRATSRDAALSPQMARFAGETVPRMIARVRA